MSGMEAVDRSDDARSGSQRWFERYPRGMPFSVFLLTLAVTVLAVFAIERAERERRQAQISETASVVAYGLERRVNSHAAYLRSGAAIFSAVPVTREAFLEFARASVSDESMAGTEGTIWAVRVAARDVPAFEEVQREFEPAFAVHPQPADDQGTVIAGTWIRMHAGSPDDLLGFDFYSDPQRRAAFDEALRTDRPTASGMLQLKGGRAGGHLERRGFILVMPVFDAGSGAATPQLRGFLINAFRAGNLLAAVAKQEQVPDLGIALYDDAPVAKNRLTSLGGFDGDRTSLHVPVELGRHRYVLAVQQPPGVTLSTMSILTLLFGMLVAALLTIVATLISRKAAEDRAALLWFREQASIRNSLTRELNHRVKNTLANVLSIIALTRRRATDVDGFAESLDGRIRALSATHDLLTQSEWGTTPIRELIGAELAPYVRDGDHAIDLLGPDVELAPNDALSLGLAIHELATNAAKYGALSVPGGKLRIHWTMITEDLTRIEWSERGGPGVPARRARGFGTELIEKIVAHELGRPVDLQFSKEGVDCVLTVPVRKPVAFRMRA
jgi:two-component sensor histidine kinase